MGWFILVHIFSIILSFMQVGRLSDEDKDLEVIILRHQLAVMARLHGKPVKPNRAEKMTLAVLTKKLRQSKNRSTNQLRDVIRIIPTPIRAPNANSCSERWIRSVREECLDHILIFNQAHLRRVLNEYLVYYNSWRPH